MSVTDMHKEIDSHFHSVHMESRGIDLETLFTDLFSRGFKGGLDIGIEPGDTELRAEKVRNFPEIRLASGIYPGFAEQMKKGESLPAALSLLENDITTYKVASVGEMGLDYHWEYGTRPLQKELLAAQIALANRVSLPIVIHSRDAAEDTVMMLSAVPADCAGIIHCFAGDKTHAGKLLDLGYCISFAGNVTYKKNWELQEVMAYVPDERLLLETDSPYLAPVPRRGKVNTPENMSHIYRFCSEFRKMDLDELTEGVLANYRKFISEP